MKRTLYQKIKFWDILMFNKTLLSMETDSGKKKKGAGMQRNYSESLSFKFEKWTETC